MHSSICTLFEGHYHYGVAALINSLYQQGFRGAVYIGYKGHLPDWAAPAVEDISVKWLGSRTLESAEGLKIHFLPVDTNFHLTNYKPYFMLRLLDGPASQSDTIAYFDPDIVIKCRWDFFERWMNHGVALVHEITSNDMPATHPIRRDWEQLAIDNKQSIQRQLHSYINAGFCGIHTNYKSFIYDWIEIIELAIRNHKPDPTKFMTFDRTYPFFSIDQDALNVAAMCSVTPISELGPEAMDFIPGGWTMSHAVGSPKPWKKNFILSALDGYPPSLADKAYWINTNTTINTHNHISIKYNTFLIKIASFIGRFYNRY